MKLSWQQILLQNKAKIISSIWGKSSFSVQYQLTLDITSLVPVSSSAEIFNYWYIHLILFLDICHHFLFYFYGVNTISIHFIAAGYSDFWIILTCVKTVVDNLIIYVFYTLLIVYFIQFGVRQGRHRAVEIAKEGVISLLQGLLLCSGEV